MARPAPPNSRANAPVEVPDVTPIYRRDGSLDIPAMQEERRQQEQNKVAYLHNEAKHEREVDAHRARQREHAELNRRAEIQRIVKSVRENGYVPSDLDPNQQGLSDERRAEYGRLLDFHRQQAENQRQFDEAMKRVQAQKEQRAQWFRQNAGRDPVMPGEPPPANERRDPLPQANVASPYSANALPYSRARQAANPTPQVAAEALRKSAPYKPGLAEQDQIQRAPDPVQSALTGIQGDADKKRAQPAGYADENYERNWRAS